MAIKKAVKKEIKSNGIFFFVGRASGNFFFLFTYLAKIDFILSPKEYQFTQYRVML